MYLQLQVFCSPTGAITNNLTQEGFKSNYLSYLTLMYLQLEVCYSLRGAIKINN